jgi:hypothetical protein
MNDARPLLEDALLLYGLGEAVKNLIGMARRWKDSYPEWRQGSPFIFTEPLITALVYNHVRETYRPEGDVTIKSNFQTEFPGYGEPEHPGGIEHYLIQARFDGVAYVYQVNSHAAVTEHFRVEGSEITPLPLPDWHGEEYFPKQASHAVRKQVIRRNP